MDIDIIMRVYMKKFTYPMFINRGRMTKTQGVHDSLVGILSFFFSFSLGEEF